MTMTTTLPPSFTCGVCRSSGPFVTYQAREMMFALGDPFDYLLCAACGCLQIETVPPDLARFYGTGYYSFGGRKRQGRVSTLMARSRNRYLSGYADPLGWLFARFRPFLALASLRPLQLPRSTRVLDVGCGGGELLIALRSAGFTNLLGVDPFVPHDLDLGAGLRVRRAELVELTGSFDLVMFHHSLEHMPEQQLALRTAHRLLSPGGRCVVRIPTVSSYAWRHYSTDWCALDAPRHLFLHSTRSISMLAKVCGFELNEIAWDSTAFQFWGSEQYRRGIALMRPGCNDIVPAPGAFTTGQLRDYSRRAKHLNLAKDGDQIVVYLRRAP